MPPDTSALAARLALLRLLLLWTAAAAWTDRRLLLDAPEFEEAAYLREWQATVVPPNASADTGWHVEFARHLPAGDVVDVVVAAGHNQVESVGHCSQACRELRSGSRAACNAFFYCPLQDGCFENSHLNYSSPLGGCTLVFQSQVAPEVGRPVLAFTAEEYIGGAPIPSMPIEVDGFQLLPGLSFFLTRDEDYLCEGSIDRTNEACVLPGNPTQHAARCTADPLCQGMTYYPRGREYGDFEMTLLKGGPGVALNISDAFVNTNSALYVFAEPKPVAPGPESQGGGSSGLSAGAIAGIVVGGCCAAALLVGVPVVLVWRQRRRLREAGGQKDESAQQSGSADPPQSGSREKPTTSSGSKEVGPDSQSSQLPPAGRGGPTPSGSSHPSSQHSPLPSAQGGGPLAVRLSDPLTSGNSGSLLSRIEDDWESCVIPWDTIHFCRNADGSYQELGSGAFSTVYRVLLYGLQPHAAKVLRVGSDPRLQEAFIRETSLLRKLRHRNIVAFVGVSLNQDRGAIIMEMMDGKDLHSRLLSVNKAGKRVLGWYGRGKTVALDVCRGLHYLHSQNLTHFDLKASNCLLTRDMTAKLADVGFTRALGGTHHSVSGSRVGTFDYMAPELLLGKRQVTQAVDMFSLGVLLWTVCSGEPPSRGCMRPLRVPEECPQEVWDLCLQCMEEDPARRPTATDVLHALNRLTKPLGSETPTAGQSGALAPVGEEASPERSSPS